MAVIIPPGYAQVTLHWQSANFDSGAAATVFGVDMAGEPNLETVGLRWATTWETNVRPLMDSQVAQAGVTIVTDAEIATVASGWVGQDSGSAAAPNVACLVRKQSTQRGRRGRGRMYIPGILGATDVLETGFLDLARMQAIQDAMEQVLQGGEVGTRDMVILQGDDGVTPPLSPPPVVQSLTVQAKAATQRRRLRR